MKPRRNPYAKSLRKQGDYFTLAKRLIKISPGEAIKMLREFKGWTQEELAKRSGILAVNISALENHRIEIGKNRAEQLAAAFKVHPAVIMFPEKSEYSTMP